MRLLVACSMVLLAACGGRPPPAPAGGGGGATDAAGLVDGGVTGDAQVVVDGPLTGDGLSGFCQGAPRLEVNGVETATAVEARPIFMNCCEAAALIFTWLTDPVRPIVVSWRAFVGTAPRAPVTVDLADLPDGFSVGVYAGCQEPLEYCFAAPESYETGLTGTLTIDGSGDFGDYTLTLCLEVAEPPDAPHPVLHSVRLWAADVAVPYFVYE